jgi:hypothetical protein
MANPAIMTRYRTSVVSGIRCSPWSQRERDHGRHLSLAAKKTACGTRFAVADSSDFTIVTEDVDK